MEQLVPDEQGRMHMGVFRWLCLLSFSARLYGVELGLS